MADNNSFEFIGKINPINSDKIKFFETKKSISGWYSKKIKFNVQCGTSSHIVEANAGVWTDNNKISANNTIKTLNKDNKPIEFPFSKRLSMTDNVTEFKKFKIKYCTSDELNEMKSNNDDISNVSKEYVHAWDFVDEIKKLFDSGKHNDNIYKVRGEISNSYNVETGKTYTNYVVHSIENVKSNTPQSSTVTVDFYYDKNGVDNNTWKETTDGKIRKATGSQIYSGYIRYWYTNKKPVIKGNFGAPFKFELTSNMCPYNNILGKFDSDCSQFRHTRIKLDAINGTEIRLPTYDELEDDLKMLYDNGTSMEEIADMCGGVAGDRVQKFVLSKVVKLPTNTEYTDSDMLPPHPQEDSQESQNTQADNVFIDEDGYEEILSDGEVPF